MPFYKNLLLAFPEYGPRRFKPPVGGAVVFSCSLPHAVARMTRGRRYGRGRLRAGMS
jgi:predicted 2-oxoglutarate/Fe(II)-dependent dioxygenase YbiX